jgi:hypothetical protein
MYYKILLRKPPPIAILITQLTTYLKETKKLIAEKRKARVTWQRTHTPDSRKRYNQTNNKLKSKLQEMRNESFTVYVSSLKRDDNTIWKPIKHKK